jgi:hypothetical protein
VFPSPAEEAANKKTDALDEAWSWLASRLETPPPWWRQNSGGTGFV